MNFGPTLDLFDADHDGDTYDPVLDKVRLNAQTKAVYLAIRDGGWYTLRQIADYVGAPEASVSARLRDLRKAKFGGFVVERKRWSGGTYRYRLASGPTVTPTEEK